MRKSMLLLAAMILATSVLNAQWQFTDGPYGGNISALAYDSTTSKLYAVSYGNGIFSSSSDGNSWNCINYGLPDIWLNGIAVNGANAFAATGHGVYYSPNSGTNWFAANSGINTQNVQALAISGTNIYAATQVSGVYVSTNNGTNWTARNSGLTGLNVFSLTAKGSTIYAGTWGELFKSDDNAANWTMVYNCNTIINAILISGSNVILASGGNGVFLSADNGNNWNPSSNGLSNKNVYSLAMIGNTLFAGTDEGVFSSVNNGSTWSAANNGISNISIRSLVVKGNLLFAGSTKNGVYVSANHGSTWTQVSNGLVTQVKSIAISGENIIAGTNGGCIFLSPDDGGSWQGIGSGMANGICVSALAVNGSDLFAGTAGNGVCYSPNNGANWMEVNNGITVNKISVHSLAMENNKIFAGTWDGGIFRTTDHGLNWSEVNNGISNYNINAIAIQEGFTFAATYGGGVFRSTNDGDEWIQMNNGLSNTAVFSFAFLDELIIAGTNGGVYASSNNGYNWAPATNGLVNPGANTMVVKGKYLFAGTDNGVYMSANKGLSWSSINKELPPNTWVNAMAIADTNVYIATDNGIWKCSYYDILKPSIKAQPINRKICAGDGVTFTVVASGDSIAYQWRHSGADIAGAVKNTLTIPYCAMQDTGSYDCYLSNGYGNILSNAAQLTVSNKPASTFSYDVTGSTVDLSTPAQPNARFCWNFDNGYLSNQPDVSYTYADPGYYNICLMVHDTLTGCQNVNCVPVNIENQTDACDARFVFSLSDNMVSFQDSSMGNPDQWYWNFGDGSIASEQNPTHTYKLEGTYTVKLAIFNQSSQCMDSYETVVTVGPANSACYADYKYFPDIQSKTVYFQDISTGSITSYFWNFGDGTSSSEQNPVHQYEADSWYNVCLSVWDSNGVSFDIACEEIIIGSGASGCNADFIYTADTTARIAYFHDVSTGEPVSWSWDFGDDSTAAEQHVAHAYAGSGYYTVHLQISNQENCSSHHIELVKISGDSTGLFCSFVPVFDSEGKASVIPVDFYGAVFGHARKIIWDFGDDSPRDSTTLSPTHIYSSRGIFLVTLSVEDPVTGESYIHSSMLDLTSASAVPEGPSCLNEIRIFPNPARDFLTVETKAQAEIEISDMQGRLIERILTTKSDPDIDLRKLPGGVYIIRVLTENGIAVKKIVKE